MQRPLRKAWCFTINNYLPHWRDKLIDDFESSAAKYIIGCEVGEEGTPHLQGYVEFNAPTRAIEKFKNFFQQDGKLSVFHWEKAKGDRSANYNYCSKEGDFKTNMDPPSSDRPRILDPLQGKTLRPFQQRILDLLRDPPDDRRVFWFWDTAGNAGKTSLCKHLCLQGGYLYVTGKAADIKYAVAEYIKEKTLKGVLFGIPRSQEQYVSYQALEEIKDGIFFSSKYEAGMCIFNPIHVFVFANFPPNYLQLSLDRWSVSEIRDHHETTINPLPDIDDSFETLLNSLQ